MAVRPILELPHPALRQRARKVRKVGPSVLRLAYDMVDTLRDAGGVGLAANQVGDLRRVIVVQMPKEEEEEEARIYINPEIVHREGEREVEEGCLSIPGYKGFITRSVWVRFTALDHSSALVKLEADGLLSQALEHEVDHLNGILYLDHLESHEKLIKIEPEPQPDHPDPGEDSSGPDQEPLVDGPDSSDDLAQSLPDPRETPASLKVR